MSQFNIDEIEKRTLSGLKDFQRATVERVDYLFRHNQNRVLVADEVGMGKTLIARGAIVKTARLRIRIYNIYIKHGSIIYLRLSSLKDKKKFNKYNGKYIGSLDV